MSDERMRQRLVLVTTALSDEEAVAALERALAGGDVASVLIDPAGREGAAFQSFAEALVPVIQAAGAAAIVIDDTRCAGRARADGLHLTGGDIDALAEAVETYAPKLIVGGSGFETRHEALEAGEALPDYLFFGRLGGDNADDPHPKTIALAEWWAAIVELPCIALAGSSVESVATIAATGAEFVALSRAVFAQAGEEGERVAEANRLLDAAFAEREPA